jgi:hypothetical protein
MQTERKVTNKVKLTLAYTLRRNVLTLRVILSLDMNIVTEGNSA